MSDEPTGDVDAPADADPASKKRRIRVLGNPDAIRKLRAALQRGALPETFVQAGEPVNIERVSGVPVLAADDDSPLPVRTTKLTSALLANLLAHHTVTVKAKANDVDEEWTPTQQVLNAVLSGAEWGSLRPLVAIVGTPVLRADGTLLVEPGYDKKTGLYLAPRLQLERIPDKPSRAEVDEALAFICDQLLGDFPWVSDGDRANYIGLMVTQILRRYRCSRVPFGLITATMAGSGKTTLSACIGLLSGQMVINWSDDDAELRKAITSVFAAEAGVVVFDNLDAGTPISSPILASLATGETWSDRILGGSRMGSWTNDRLWLFTGNNLHVGGDIARRSVLVRLAPNTPRPEEVTGQTIPALDSWILDPDNQATVLRHLLVLILDWCNAGAPLKRGQVLGQFTAWADVVGGFLDHHGIKGFLDNVAEVRARDDDAREWAGFFALWHQRYGHSPRTAGELCSDANGAAMPGADPWHGLFPTDRRGEPLSAKKLGWKLRPLLDTYRGDYVLRGEMDGGLNQWRYWIEQFIPPAPDSEAMADNPGNPGTRKHGR